MTAPTAESISSIFAWPTATPLRCLDLLDDPQRSFDWCAALGLCDRAADDEVIGAVPDRPAGRSDSGLVASRGIRRAYTGYDLHQRAELLMLSEDRHLPRRAHDTIRPCHYKQLGELEHFGSRLVAEY